MSTNARHPVSGPAANARLNGGGGGGDEDGGGKTTAPGGNGGLRTSTALAIEVLQSNARTRSGTDTLERDRKTL